METHKVGIRDFRAALAEYIDAQAPVEVTRHGQTVGLFIPTHGHSAADVAALKRASMQLDRLLAVRQLDADAVVVEFMAERRAGKAGKAGKTGKAGTAGKTGKTGTAGKARPAASAKKAGARKR